MDPPSRLALFVSPSVEQRGLNQALPFERRANLVVLLASRDAEAVRAGGRIAHVIGTPVHADHRGRIPAGRRGRPGAGLKPMELISGAVLLCLSDETHPRFRPAGA